VLEATAERKKVGGDGGGEWPAPQAKEREGWLCFIPGRLAPSTDLPNWSISQSKLATPFLFLSCARGWRLAAWRGGGGERSAVA